MFKFLRGQKKQQNTENAGIPDPPAPDTINYENAESGLEEVLKPLFLREEPISPEEFATPKMSFFRRLSNLSKRDSRSNFKTINSTPPPKTTSPIEEEKRDIGSNEEDSIYTARLDDEESSNDAVPRMTSCFGSEIGTVLVAEAERLWARFQQLGPNDEQTLPNEAFQQHLFTSDPFARQILRTFPRDENGSVNFHVFVGVFKWWKTAPLDKKLAGIFKLLNKSQPLDVPVLQQILMSLDSSIDEETAKSRAELLVKTLDDKDQGYIDADQWVNWILQFPEDEVTKLTKFSIIPEELDTAAPHSRPETEHVSAISDELLIDIAGKIGEKDWTPLARELGFTKQEIREVKRQNPHRSREQIYQVLILWRQKLGREATVAALEQSLSNSGMQT